MVLYNLAIPGEAYYSYVKSENYDDLHYVREKSIYDNFIRAYEHFPKGKYFGQFGSAHIHQKYIIDYMYGKGRFGIYLNQEDSPVKGKVLSIKYGYKDSCYLVKEPDVQRGKYQYREETSASHLNNMRILERYLDKDITIFKLNGKGSSFKEELYFVQDPNGGVTTDYFQYIVVNKGFRSNNSF
ncbi:hypothetical protein [Tepidimicrobium xylanilyticum]|uniref:hypothetical protein n=1 Tax=Tepidimicrobium xylanilyticum TaxID=1123352 RepID=UPI00264E37C7|nr:hypothetical protein [Tepidimicrobium xylanilyticum]GMG96777.1 hypothetical protein EN5CB1_16030 [Tepidimicrobium xylanilyticum]